MQSNIPDIILQETKNLPEDLLKEVLDFVLFLKSKRQNSSAIKIDDLSFLQQSELKHLEEEFADYQQLYPNE